jgi:LAS superfamily LD-carboxypeptidase LdcB
VSAPPGFSEHHTGYALDIGDLAAPETELEPGESDSYKGALELS